MTVRHWLTPRGAGAALARCEVGDCQGLWEFTHRSEHERHTGARVTTVKYVRYICLEHAERVAKRHKLGGLQHWCGAEESNPSSATRQF